MQRLLLPRSEAEIIELTRHGFVALIAQEGKDDQLVGFSAVEIYGPKLAELQCLAVHPQAQGSGVGRVLVDHCVARARELKQWLEEYTLGELWEKNIIGGRPGR